MKFPETEVGGARARGAIPLRARQLRSRARRCLNGGSDAPRRSGSCATSRELVRGQVLRALGRTDEAVAAFRAALAAWPGAQSARVALMTLLVSRGDRDGAGALAEAAQTASDDDFDPWWTYWLGDFRALSGDRSTGCGRWRDDRTVALAAVAARSRDRRCRGGRAAGRRAGSGAGLPRRRRRRQRRSLGAARSPAGRRD